MPAGKNSPGASRPAATGARLAPAFRLDANRPLSQQVYELLRSAVGDLRLLPNHVLSEKDVADELGVSRTPVREAFIRLSEDGIVRIVPKSGTYIAPISIERVNEGYFIWRGLESFCAARIAENSAFGGISLLRGLVTSQNNCLLLGDESGFHAANESFHEAIFTLADFPGAAEMVSEARFEIRRLLGLNGVAEFEMTDAVVTEQWNIVNLIAEKRPDETRAEVLKHLARLKDAIDRAAAAMDEAHAGSPAKSGGKRQRI